jgi:hypothetical protein
MERRQQQIGQLVRHDGLAEQKALHFIAIVIAQEARLLDVSTPSATTVIPSALPMLMIAWAIA